MRSRYRCSMCPAIHINSRSWLRSSSTHEPSDPPLRVVFPIMLSKKAKRSPSGQRPGNGRARQTTYKNNTTIRRKKACLSTEGSPSQGRRQSPGKQTTARKDGASQRRVGFEGKTVGLASLNGRHDRVDRATPGDATESIGRLGVTVPRHRRSFRK